MISIKTTKKLNGISIQGDFEDLNHLYDALSEYTNFYIDGIMLEIESDYVKHHGVAIKDMTSDQRDEFLKINKHEIDYFEEMRENLLGLCYDIRHAYQGDRGIGLVENGCELLSECSKELPSMNLQFNVEVLYPWAFYYLFALRDMLDNMYKPEWFDSIGEYGVTRRESDIHLYRGVLDTFIALLWKNLEELFGKEYEAFYTITNTRTVFLCLIDLISREFAIILLPITAKDLVRSNIQISKRICCLSLPMIVWIQRIFTISSTARSRMSLLPRSLM